MHDVPESRESGISFLDLLLISITVVTTHDALVVALFAWIFENVMVAIASPVLLDLARRRCVGPAMRPERQTLQTARTLGPSGLA